MTAWEYRCVELGREGTRDELDSSWTYGDWEIGASQKGKEPLYDGLQELGREGWELAGVLPGDFWAEGTRVPGGAHGVRTISALLIFRRPVGDQNKQSNVAGPSEASQD